MVLERSIVDLSRRKRVMTKSMKQSEATILIAQRELRRLDQLVRDYSDAISEQVDSAVVLAQMSTSLERANEILESGLPEGSGYQL